MAIKPLNLTSTYMYAERASENSLTNIVMAYSLGKNGTVRVDNEMIEEPMHDITSRTSPFTAKYAIERLVNSGKIEIVYNESLRLTNAIPFFRKQENGKTIMVVNITNFGQMRKDGTINIPSNILYAMLLSAAFNLTIEGSILSYAREAHVMYSRLFANVIGNLSYMDQTKKEKIQYLATNFFYYTIYGPDKTFNNPMMGTLRYNSKEAIVSLDSKFPMYNEHSAYENLEVFIANLNKVFPEMTKLTYKNFIDRWTFFYGSSTFFASEYIPFFFYMIISTAALSNAVNINKISNEVASGLSAMYKKIQQQVNDFAN